MGQLGGTEGQELAAHWNPVVEILFLDVVIFVFQNHNQGLQIERRLVCGIVRLDSRRPPTLVFSQQIQYVDKVFRRIILDIPARPYLSENLSGP